MYRTEHYAIEFVPVLEEESQIRPITKLGESCQNVCNDRLPGGGAVPVEDVEVLTGEQLASVDARLYGSETTQDPHLFHVAY